MDQKSPTIRSKSVDEKFCGSCGEIIKIKAEICPKCGVRQGNPLSKTALLLITFFFGGIGAHKFYIGKNWQGVLYFLFFWTGIPGLIALIEFIIYIFTSSEKLQQKYSSTGGGVVIAAIACFIGLFFIVGILAAIAIPQFAAYRNKAYQNILNSELQNFLVAEQTYFAEHNRYSANIKSLNFIPTTQDITIEIIGADENCFEAVAKHNHLADTISVDCNGLKNF